MGVRQELRLGSVALVGAAVCSIVLLLWIASHGGGSGAGVPEYDVHCRLDAEVKGCRETALPRARNVTVAFLADQGTSENAVEVLRLVRAHGAELVVHQGDLSYGAVAEEWDEMYSRVLGRHFPLVAAFGNHDRPYMDEFQMVFDRRTALSEGLQWEGCKGVRSRAAFKGLELLQVSVGVLPGSNRPPEWGEDGEAFREEQHGFLQQQLHCKEEERQQTGQSRWTICSFHSFSPTDGSIGGKDVEMALRACSESGAVIFTAHAHTYRRFYPFPHSNSEEKTIKVRNNQLLHIRPGTTVQMVVGLGGDSVEEEFNKGLALEFGAMVCVFNPVDESGELYPALSIIKTKSPAPEEINFAHCKMVGVSGKVFDEFSMYIPQD